MCGSKAWAGVLAPLLPYWTMTQLLVPKCRQELLFQAAHHNPMTGHLSQDKTVGRLVARFYWPGIRGDVLRWCTACRECQLVNLLFNVPFERIGMELVGPLH